MDLTNEFRVGVGIDRAWAVLTDVERIAPCMPGAELQEVHGDEYRGIVKVKVGPITAQYKGKATFVEQDEPNHRAVLSADGRDTSGRGNANATITATLAPDGDGTKVTIATDLKVTGRVAQFGRGVLAEVSAKLLDQFVACLETSVLNEPAAAPEAAAPEAAAPAEVAALAAGAPEPAETGPRKIDSKPAEPVDLVSTAGAPVVKRVGPIVALAALLWLIRILVRRRRKL